MMDNDLLYEIFIYYLNDQELVSCEQDLVYEVVGDYMYHLNVHGHTPSPHMDDIEDLIRDEVLDMYRKKTYGFRSLIEYRLSLTAQSH